MRRDIDRKARAVADEGAHQFGCAVGAQMHPVGGPQRRVTRALGHIAQPHAQILEQEAPVAVAFEEKRDGGAARAHLAIVGIEPRAAEGGADHIALGVGADKAEVARLQARAHPLHRHVEGIAPHRHAVLRQIDIETIVAHGDQGRAAAHGRASTGSRCGASAVRWRVQAATGSRA